MVELTQPTISVVIPTRNRVDVLDECLERLGKEADACKLYVEAVIIDTSTSATPLNLSPHPFLRVRYRYDGDMPFSLIYARNEGLAAAQADIIAYIDDDCFVLPGWLEALLEPYEDPDTLATGGRIIYHPWYPVKHGGSVAQLQLEQDRVWAEWDTVLPHPITVSHLPGGNFSVRRNLAVKVGGFDPGFTGSANLEETDFFIRLGTLGGRVVFNPRAVVEHRAAPRADGIERSFNNYLYRKSAVRNRLYLLRKHASKRAVVRGLWRQLKDLTSGTVHVLIGAVVFAIASMVGIVAGLTVRLPTPVQAKNVIHFTDMAGFARLHVEEVSSPRGGDGH